MRDSALVMAQLNKGDESMFKKGDKVRVVASDSYQTKHMQLPIGFETVIMENPTTHDWAKNPYVTVRGINGKIFTGVSATRFEKIKEFEPKSGMIAKIKGHSNIYWGLFIQVGEKLVRISDYNCKGNYNGWQSPNTMLDVIEVYEGMHNNVLAGLNHNLGAKPHLGKLLWRKEPKIKVVELSIDEIAKKFNLKPEQVRIKKEQ